MNQFEITSARVSRGKRGGMLPAGKIDNTSMKPLISVIIPVYNAEKYLRRCYRSLLRQTFQEFEILFVDDSSTDRSVEILTRIAAEDSRVQLIRNRENLGQGRSRDAGISAATGEYLFFLDADDYLAPRTLSELLTTARAEQADIVVFGMHHLYCFFDRVYPRYTRQVVACGKDLVEPFLLGFHPTSPLQNPEGYECNKLISRKLIQENALHHGTGRKLGEDTLFVARLLLLAGKIVFHPGVFYFYERRNSASMTASRKTELFLTQLETFAVMRDLLFSAAGPQQANWERLFRETVCRRLYFEFMDRLSWCDDSQNRALFRSVADRMKLYAMEWDIDCGHNGYNRFRAAMRAAIEPPEKTVEFSSAVKPLKWLKFKTLYIPRWVAASKHAIERIFR